MGDRRTGRGVWQSPSAAKALDLLEPRRLFTVFTVTSNADAGVGSLRAAITNANANVGADAIHFNLASGQRKISVTSALPAVTGVTTIDGTTQAGYAGTPLVWLDGSGVTLGAADGLRLSADNSSVSGLAVTGFVNGAGVRLSGSTDSVTKSVIGNEPSGTDLTGSFGNQYGVELDGTAATVNFNVISGNISAQVYADGALFPVISNNLIGTDVTGTAGVASYAAYGVLALNSQGVEIGGADASLANTISGNGVDAVRFVGGNSLSVDYNFIGTDITGAFAIGNGGSGVSTDGAIAITVSHNVISASGGDGIQFSNSEITAVVGNLIGLDATGSTTIDGNSAVLGNLGNGINILGAGNSQTIGQSDSFSRNVIAGSFGDGVRVSLNATDTASIDGNYIGTDATGLIALPNLGNGITIISGDVDILNNVVSGNAANGIQLAGGTRVGGNLIGVGPDGVTPVPNAGDGIAAYGDGNIIGFDDAYGYDGNVIANNLGNGVTVVNGVKNRISRNSIHDNYYGIELGYGNGVIQNDSLGHIGPNNFQNFPVLATATTDAGMVTFDGTLHVLVAGTYTVEFFSAALPDMTGYGQGKTYLGSVSVVVGASGVGTVSGTYAVPAGENVFMVTAIDADGNTSQFSADINGQAAVGPVLVDTATSLSSNANPSSFGQGVTFTALVSAATGTAVPQGSITFTEGTVTLGVVTVSPTGTAQLVLSGLSTGHHSVVATYSGLTLGDGSGFNPSASSVFDQNVVAAATATTVSSSANPSGYLSTVSFTANVAVLAPGAGVAGGVVQFFDGTTLLGQESLTNGVAVLTTSTLLPGTHNVTASYLGSSDFNGSLSALLGQLVNQAATTTSVVSSVADPLLGDSVTFTATVAGPLGTTGVVGFFDGATLLGYGTLGGGVATLTTSALTAGSHNITAIYGGDAQSAGSTSAPLVQSVLTASTISGYVYNDVNNNGLFDAGDNGLYNISLTLTGVNDRGQSVTSTVTTTAGGLFTFTGLRPSGPTGYTITESVPVDYLASQSTIGSQGGVAAAGSFSGLVITSGTVGTNNKMANLTSQDTYVLVSSIATWPGQSSNGTNVIGNFAYSTYGQIVKFTASVRPYVGDGIPQGLVTFFDGTTVLQAVTVDVNGVATFETTTLVPGTHNISASYGGQPLTLQGGYRGSTSPMLYQIVAKASSATVVGSDTPTPLVGDSVTFTATVTAVGAFGGTVGFYDGTTLLGTGTISGTTASFTTSALGAGIHTITAQYSGDAYNNGSVSAPIYQNVLAPSAITGYVYNDANNDGTFGNTESGLVGVTVTLSGLNDLGNPVNLTTVTTAGGAYSFSGLRPSDSAGYTLAHAVPNAFIAGQASVGTQGGVVGQGSISGIHLGVNVTGSSNNFGDLTSVATTTSLVSSASPSVFGQGVTFTATVSGISGTAVPQGFVTFTDGGTTLGVVTVGTNGTATLSLGSLAVGPHALVATYSGQALTTAGGFDASASPTLNQNVVAAPTVTAVATSVNPSVYLSMVSFTATVGVTGQGAGTVAGTVSFFDGATFLGQAAVSSGQAVLTLGSLLPGTHNVTAQFQGTANFATSVSPSLSQLVNKRATTTVVTVSVSNPLLGDQVALSATVSGSTAITGNVNFYDGATLIGTGTLSGTVATLVTSSLAAGTHNITATYAGDSVNLASTAAPAPLAVITASSISGAVYLDANNDGIFATGETPVANVSVTLSGVNDRGVPVSVTTTTTAGGAYSFAGLRPSNASGYSVTEVPPSGYIVGKSTVGTVAATPGAAMFSAIVIGPGVSDANNNLAVLTTRAAGTVYKDLTGNGLSADDTGYAGVTVSVFKDVNNNGKYDSGTDTLQGTQVSSATGAFEFVNLAAGKYLVREAVPTGTVRTAPALLDYYVVTIAGGSNLTNLNFDNYTVCTSCATSVTSIKYYDNGVLVSDLRGRTKMNDTVSVQFTVPAGKTANVHLVSYTAPGSTFVAADASQQAVYQVAGGLYNPGTYTISVVNPNQYYQVDFVCGEVISTFGPASSNIFYSAQSRLFSADNAGLHSDTVDQAATMGFWANLGQSLINDFNGGSTSTNLANWLSATLPNLYGATSGANSMTGKTNADVLATYNRLYGVTGTKFDAQVMATALNVYATNSNLSGTTATGFGFAVDATGLADATFNVQGWGTAFGLANNSTTTVMDLLTRANARSSNGVLFNGNSANLNLAFSMFSYINAAGGLD